SGWMKLETKIRVLGSIAIMSLVFMVVSAVSPLDPGYGATLSSKVNARSIPVGIDGYRQVPSGCKIRGIANRVRPDSGCTPGATNAAVTHAIETDPQAIKALREALALVRLKSPDPAVKLAALKELESLREICGQKRVEFLIPKIASKIS
ncbi:MAG: hypothetical protein NT160_01320, partial [Actinobacteria bacterium]|nr:hypothetical protein [Actinomycetota bacterium]